MGLVATMVLTGCAAPTPAGSSPAGTHPFEDTLPGWETDFGRMAEGVTMDQFVRALAGRDLIPPIDAPRFLPVTEVDFLSPVEPVIAVEVGGQWRAYPIQILIWHEIVNDTIAGEPITVTFCPLCYTSVVFDRRLGGRVLDFGVTGYLRRSDLVMWDRQTETWWQQASGHALGGELVGEILTIRHSQLTSWATFRDTHREAEVLSRETGHSRDYGTNPYPGWDDTVRNPFLEGDQLEVCEGDPECIDPKERVGVLLEAEETVIYRFSEVAAAGSLAHDRVGGTPVVVWWLPEVASALDSQLLEQGDQVGTMVAFDRRLDDLTLDLTLRNGILVDRQTGSGWNAFGEATHGPLEGERLRRLVMDTPYWFAAASFAGGLRVWQP